VLTDYISEFISSNELVNFRQTKLLLIYFERHWTKLEARQLLILASNVCKPVNYN